MSQRASLPLAGTFERENVKGKRPASSVLVDRGRTSRKLDIREVGEAGRCGAFVIRRCDGMGRKDSVARRTSDKAGVLTGQGQYEADVLPQEARDGEEVPLRAPTCLQK